MRPVRSVAEVRKVVGEGREGCPRRRGLRHQRLVLQDPSPAESLLVFVDVVVLKLDVQGEERG